MRANNEAALALKKPGRKARRRSQGWRRWLVRVIVLGLSVAISLLVCEMAIRTFRPQLLFPRYVTNGGFGVRVNVPNARYWHTSPEMQVQFRINSMGIRSDREYAYVKPAGTIRIIGLGDSFTAGYEVNVHETYLYHLENNLRNRGYPVEVVNLGVSGHGTAEELVLLHEFGLRFAPDLVIVGYYQNDLADNIRSRLFRLDDNEGLVRAASSYLPGVRIRDRLYSFGAFRWLAENSQLFSLARESLATFVKRKMLESSAATPGDTADGNYAERLGAALLDEINTTCVDNGSALFVLDITGRSLGGSNLPTSYFRHIASDQIVFTTERLKAEGSNAYLYRRKGHLHWTPRAHEIAAELLADRVAEKLAL